MAEMEICHLFISPGHNFVGHHGREPDAYPMIETSEMECVAGRGIRGDRYFDFKDDYKGQITFFSLEVFDELCDAMQSQPCSPSVARRNVITRGVDLNDLIGQEFEVQRNPHPALSLGKGEATAIYDTVFDLTKIDRSRPLVRIFARRPPRPFKKS